MCYNQLIPSVSYRICDLLIVEYSKIEIVHGKVCTRNYDGRIYKSKIKDLDSNDLSLDNSMMLFGPRSRPHFVGSEELMFT
jgi:hypothetical protein